MAALFQMLHERRIQPIIAERLPFTEARGANELLEKGARPGQDRLNALSDLTRTGSRYR